MTSRSEQLGAGLQRVRERIAAACRAAGRDPGEVTLIVVTKTHPAADVQLLARLAVTDVGENRDQEAAPKALACQNLALHWHFIGRLQTNKARSVAGYATAVHSLDRPEVVAALGRAALRAERRVRCFVQVSLDGAPGRGGAPATELPRLAALIAGQECLDLAGVMAVAPLGLDPEPAFAALAALSAALRGEHPTASGVSAGMSGDLEQAIRYGATHLRVGSAVLGERPPLE